METVQGPCRIDATAQVARYKRLAAWIWLCESGTLSVGERGIKLLKAPVRKCLL
jgi:hypothetical protein